MKSKINTLTYVLVLLLALSLTNMLWFIWRSKPEPIVEKEIVVETKLVQDNIYIEKEIELVEYERVEVFSYAEAVEQLEVVDGKINDANIAMENFSSLGYSYSTLDTWYVNFLYYMEEERIYYQDKADFYWEQEQIGLWETRKEEYPVATTIWLYLKEQGFNDYVAAGILGNMMTEAGGQTMYINVCATNGSYYGICQWGTGFPGRYTDLDGQLQLLMDTIENEFNWYGNMSYSDFCELENEQTAALAFAKSYERCTSTSYTQRQYNATTAYNYFVN